MRVAPCLTHRQSRMVVALFVASWVLLLVYFQATSQNTALTSDPVPDDDDLQQEQQQPQGKDFGFHLPPSPPPPLAAKQRRRRGPPRGRQEDHVRQLEEQEQRLKAQRVQEAFGFQAPDEEADSEEIEADEDGRQNVDSERDDAYIDAEEQEARDNLGNDYQDGAGGADNIEYGEDEAAAANHADQRRDAQPVQPAVAAAAGADAAPDKGDAADWQPEPAFDDEQEAEDANGYGEDEQDEPEPDVIIGATSEQLHGPIGLDKQGNPAFKLGPRPEAKAGPAQLRDNGFYLTLSDSIDLDRPVPDSRYAECRSVKYDLDTLPSTSVIFVFHNEAMSTLLRSIHSVLNRSPPKLLKEIILVDDKSVKSWLGEELENQIKFLPKVKLIRMPERSGLVKARLAGARAATGETFTVLDSHIEVQPGWLEPLMFRISQGREHVVMPIIDSINARTFQPEAHGIGRALGFLWSLWEHGISPQKVHEAQRTSPVDPVPSPTHAGGLFSVNREFFWEIGGYDPDFGFWGAENVEFSFRIWQCGGRLECMPCSRVYHIFRDGGKPYSSPVHHLKKNRLRTAAIWTDEFEFIVRDALGVDEEGPGFDIGPLDNMRALRRKLECRPFSWFLKEVYPENFLTSLDDILGYGNVRNAEAGRCLKFDFDGDGSPVTLGECPDPSERQQGWMVLKQTGVRPIANLELCVNTALRLMFCEFHESQTQFEYLPDQSWLRHRYTRKCLAAAGNNLQYATCSDGPGFRWELDRSTVDLELEKFHQQQQPPPVQQQQQQQQVA